MKKSLALLILLFFAFFLPSPAWALDPLPYFFPPGNPGNNISSGEYFQTSGTGTNEFTIYKSHDHDYYERFLYDADFLYHAQDTTWATEAGNVICQDGSGHEAYFIPWDPAGGYGRWLPRQLDLGECAQFPIIIKGYSKVTHQECPAPFTGATTLDICLVYQGCLTFPTEVTSQNAIQVQIRSGPGAGENFFYDFNRGWIGFNRGTACSGAYVTDEIDPKTANCQTVAIQDKLNCQLSIEPQTFEPQQSLVCTDFAVENQAAAGGWLELTLQRFPDLSQMEKVVDQLLDINLTAKFKQALAVTSQEMETRAKHFLVAANQTSTTSTPETKITLPAIWTRLLAKTRIFCAFFGSSPACEPSSVDLTVVPPDANALAAQLSPNTNCSSGSFPGAEIDLNSQTLRADLVLPAADTFQIRSRELLVGGHDFIEQSAAFASQLPSNLNLGYSSLSNTAQFSLASGLVAGAGADRLNAQGLGLAYTRYCLFRCQEYSQTYLDSIGGISALEPLCPSCNLKDYPQETSQKPGVIEYPAPPQTCSADAFHEIIPSCAQCQDVLFCWGNNYRLCETDPQIAAPALGSRNESWWFSPGDFQNSTVLYNGMSFSVPGGGVYVCDSNVFGCVNERCR